VRASITVGAFWWCSWTSPRRRRQSLSCFVVCQDSSIRLRRVYGELDQLLPFRQKTTSSHRPECGRLKRRDKRCTTRQCTRSSSFCHIHQQHARRSESHHQDVCRRKQAHRNHPQRDRFSSNAAGPGRIIRVTFSSNLKFASHIRAQANKAVSIIGQLRLQVLDRHHFQNTLVCIRQTSPWIRRSSLVAPYQ